MARIFCAIFAASIRASTIIDEEPENDVAFDALPYRSKEWRKIISSLEYLNDNHKDLFLKYSSNIQTPPKSEKTLEQALAYFILRHCTDVVDFDDFLASLCFCLFCERLLCSIVVATNICRNGELAELARIISEEIEYSEDNTEAIKFELSACI